MGNLRLKRNLLTNLKWSRGVLSFAMSGIRLKEETKLNFDVKHLDFIEKMGRKISASKFVDHLLESGDEPPPE